MTHFEQYIQRYLNIIPSQNWLQEMELAGNATSEIYRHLTEEQANFAYAEGKWSLKILLQHLIDAEKIFAYRALRFSRNDDTELAGWDEEQYGTNNNVSFISLNDLIEEFEAVRKTSLLFFKNLSPEILARKGIANANEISVETIGQLITGHHLHHLSVIRERYLKEK